MSSVIRETSSLIGRIGSVMEMLRIGRDQLQEAGSSGAAKRNRKILDAAAHSPTDPEALASAAAVFLKPLNQPLIATKLLRLAHDLDKDNAEIFDLLGKAQQACAASKLMEEVEAPRTRAHFGKMITQSLPSAASMIKRTGRLLDPAIAHNQDSRESQTVDRSITDEMAALSGPQLMQQAELAHSRGDSETALALAIHAKHRAVSSDSVWSLFTTIAGDAQERGYHDIMIEAYQEAVRVRPDVAASWFNLGLGLHRSGQLDAAANAHQKALEIDPSNERILAELSATFFDLEDYERAEDHAREALEQKPDYDSAWDKLCNALGAQGYLDQAIIAAKQGLQYSPHSPKLLFKLGAMLFDEDRYEEARACLTRAGQFQNAPEAPLVLRYNVLLAVQAKDFELAIMALEEAGKSPENWAAWNDLNLSYQDIGKFERAAWAGRNAVKLKPEAFEAWLNLGLAYQKAEMLTDSEDAYEQAISREPSTAQAWHNLGVVLSEQGEYSRSVQALHRVVQIDPQDATAYYDLAIALDRAGKHDEAAEAERAAIDLTSAKSRRTQRSGFWSRIFDALT